MKEKEYLYKLMYAAFVQMRAEAYERKDKGAFWICDAFHNVPLKLLNIKKEEDCIKIYQELEHYFNSNRMNKWLESEISEIEKMNNYTPNKDG